MKSMAPLEDLGIDEYRLRAMNVLETWLVMIGLYFDGCSCY